MAIEAASVGRGTNAAAVRTEAGTDLNYSMYGLRVNSEIRLPIAPDLFTSERSVDVVVRRAQSHQPMPEPDGPLVSELRCDLPCHNGKIASSVRRGPGGAWFWHAGAGTIHVRPDTLQVDVYTEHDTDERLLGLVLVGQVSVFILHQRGRPTLHASAAVTEHGAAVFFGPNGYGKSTMAASFLRRGAPLLSDDVLPLQLAHDGVYALPSLPMMKVWQETVDETLRLSDDLPSLTTKVDKKLFALAGPYALAQAPARVRALYSLARYELTAGGPRDIAVQPLNKRDSLAVVLAQISEGGLLTPSDVARFLPLYTRLVAQTPVRRLIYPNGFQYQDAVYETIQADLVQLEGKAS
jgi:hypothetical protein